MRVFDYEQHGLLAPHQLKQLHDRGVEAVAPLCPGR